MDPPCPPLLPVHSSCSPWFRGTPMDPLLHLVDVVLASCLTHFSCLDCLSQIMASFRIKLRKYRDLFFFWTRGLRFCLCVPDSLSRLRQEVSVWGPDSELTPRGQLSCEGMQESLRAPVVSLHTWAGAIGLESRTLGTCSLSWSLSLQLLFT